MDKENAADCEVSLSVEVDLSGGSRDRLLLIVTNESDEEVHTTINDAGRGFTAHLTPSDGDAEPLVLVDCQDPGRDPEAGKQYLTGDSQRREFPQSLKPGGALEGSLSLAGILEPNSTYYLDCSWTRQYYTPPCVSFGRIVIQTNAVGKIAVLNFDQAQYRSEKITSRMLISGVRTDGDGIVTTWKNGVVVDVKYPPGKVIPEEPSRAVMGVTAG